MVILPHSAFGTIITQPIVSPVSSCCSAPTSTCGYNLNQSLLMLQTTIKPGDDDTNDNNNNNNNNNNTNNYNSSNNDDIQSIST